MSAEPVPIVPVDDGNFTSDATTVVVLGGCRCPGRPHDEDTAEVLREMPWGALTDAGVDGLSSSDRYRILTVGALMAWNLVDADGEPVPIRTETVARLRPDRVVVLSDAVNEAVTRSAESLPNAPGAPSRRSRRESASPNPTIRPHAKPTKSR